MGLGLTGRRALVTGSTQGIGRATAEAPASDGALVVVNGRDPARTQQVAFLCSERASAVNGAAQRVDGGIIRAML